MTLRPLCCRHPDTLTAQLLRQVDMTYKALSQITFYPVTGKKFKFFLILTTPVSKTSARLTQPGV